jgi:O-acetyl-ADP-ribose deacetylase (regulator of RNase III)/uncharacterized protein YwgA
MGVVDITIGDILDSGAQTLVNTVNTEGVMGKGIAYQFKQRFPDMYEEYVELCKQGQVELGRPYIWRGVDAWVINFPTKDRWRSISRLEDIVAGLEYLGEHYEGWGVRSLAVPPLGCGEGLHEWRIVGRILYQHFNDYDIPVTLYAPFGTVDAQLTREFLASELESPFSGAGRIPPAWAALATILHRIEQEPYRPPVGRMAFQKVVYFATEEGLPTDLVFEKGSFGPFSKGLKRMEARLINNRLLTETRRGRMLAIDVGPAYEAAIEMYSDEIEVWRDIIDRVAELFLRFDTNQAEIAGTVHFAANRLVEPTNGKPTEMDVLEAVQDWKVRRTPPLDEGEVARMIRNLHLLGWLDLEPSPDLPLPEDALVDELEFQEAL